MDSERRYATVVYADISGFTAISEQLDPERVTEVMNRCFEILEGVVIAHGGTVNKYLGDAVMALFGLDGDQANPPHQAVEAGVEIRNAIRGFSKEMDLPAPLDVHVGVNSGEVIAGIIGGEIKREFTVTGDAVAVAARLEDVSDNGQIFVGPETYRDTQETFEYRRVDPVVLREHEPPIPVYEFVGVKPAHRRVKRDSERRQATVLFADLSGFRVLADSMAPEAVTDLLNECFRALEPVVVDHGGVVDKYVGECLMALFGVPNAIENAPQQAINAAIEIRNRLTAFNEAHDLRVPIVARSGINTGLVIAGEMGGRIKRDFTVMGDTVNLAARMRDVAPTGAIYVASETYRYTKDAFDFRTLEPLSLKGKAQAVPTYEVLSETERAHRAPAGGAERSISSELVGRDDELQRLLGHVGQLTVGRGSIVSLIGEAGVGKSRITSEVLDRAAPEGVQALVGRSASTGANLSFHPFIDLLERWAGVAEDDDEQAQLAKLERAMLDVAVDTAAEQLPFVATLMGLRLPEEAAARMRDIDGDALEKLIFKSVRELFVAIAERRPMLMILEDLHWADQSSLGLLDVLLRLATDRAVMFLLVFRPDYQQVAEQTVAAAVEKYGDWYDEIKLEPLSEQHAALLVENLLRIDDLPLSTRQLIIGKSEGNPFYIEEVVRTLIDQGAVEYVDGRYAVTEKIDTVEIPGTIQDVIMARVDRLDESTRHVVQLASVIGRTFSYALIAEILERGGHLDDSLGVRLEDLRERQILVQLQRQWEVTVRSRTVLDEIEYIFKHALAQQTIYESLLQKTKKELHGSVAYTIETVFTERVPDFYGMLAYHYSQAENDEKAEAYLFKAGEEAARSAASSEALNLFEEASRLYLVMHPDGGDPHKRMLLEKNIALAHWNKGNLSESIERFNSTLGFLGEKVPTNTVALYSRFATDFVTVLYQLYVRGISRRVPADLEHEKLVFDVIYDRSRAQATSEDSVRLFIDNMNGIRRLGATDPRQIDQACGMYATTSGLFAFAAISFDVSRRFLAVSEQAIRPNDVRDRFSYGTFRLVNGLLTGDWRDEIAIAPELVEEALKGGQLWDVNTYLGLNCSRLFRRGDFEAARTQLEKLAEMRDSYGYDFASSNYDGTLAMLLAEERSLDEGMDVVDRYYATRHEPALRVLALGTKAKIQLLAGDVDGAEASLARADEIVARTGTIAPWHLGNHAVARLRCDLARTAGSGTGTAARAVRKSASHALRIARAVAEQRAEVYRLLGELATIRGKHGKAVRWWKKSIDEGERIGARPELARTYAAIARSADGGATVSGVGLSALECRDRARGLFEAMQLVDEAAKLDA